MVIQNFIKLERYCFLSVFYVLKEITKYINCLLPRKYQIYIQNSKLILIFCTACQSRIWKYIFLYYKSWFINTEFTLITDHQNKFLDVVLDPRMFHHLGQGQSLTRHLPQQSGYQVLGFGAHMRWVGDTNFSNSLVCLVVWLRLEWWLSYQELVGQDS